MTLIVYGKEREIFTSDSYSVPDAIVELYKYVGGGIDEDLFNLAIDGMVKTAGIQDMVRLFNVLALETPIQEIYTGANKYWVANDERL